MKQQQQQQPLPRQSGQSKRRHKPLKHRQRLRAIFPWSRHARPIVNEIGYSSIAHEEMKDSSREMTNGENCSENCSLPFNRAKIDDGNDGSALNDRDCDNDCDFGENNEGVSGDLGGDDDYSSDSDNDVNDHDEDEDADEDEDEDDTDSSPENWEAARARAADNRESEYSGVGGVGAGAILSTTEVSLAQCSDQDLVQLQLPRMLLLLLLFVLFLFNLTKSFILATLSLLIMTVMRTYR